MIIKYCIMCFIFGFTGNKLLGKNKTTNNSIIFACKITIILLIINMFFIVIKKGGYINGCK